MLEKLYHSVGGASVVTQIEEPLPTAGRRRGAPLPLRVNKFFQEVFRPYESDH
jgi:hypothetical protein